MIAQERAKSFLTSKLSTQYATRISVSDSMQKVIQHNVNFNTDSFREEGIALGTRKYFYFMYCNEFSIKSDWPDKDSDQSFKKRGFACPQKRAIEGL